MHKPLHYFFNEPFDGKAAPPDEVLNPKTAEIVKMLLAKIPPSVEDKVDKPFQSNFQAKAVVPVVAS